MGRTACSNEVRKERVRTAPRGVFATCRPIELNPGAICVWRPAAQHARNIVEWWQQMVASECNSGLFDKEPYQPLGCELQCGGTLIGELHERLIERLGVSADAPDELESEERKRVHGLERDNR